MNPPFKLITPTGNAVPLVLDSPHSGADYPDDFRAAVGYEALRQSEDSFVDELYGSDRDAFVPARGATCEVCGLPESECEGS